MYQAIYLLPNKLDNMTSIYALLKENYVFYIGKTINIHSRLYVHKQKYGFNIEIIILDEVEDNEWVFWEKYYISLFKSWGYILKNKNDGGGGTTRGTLQKSIKLKKSKSKSILQYDLEGNFIREWESAKQVADTLNLTNSSGITYSLKSNSPTAYKSIWRYKTENYLLKINPPQYWENNLIPILQYDLQGNLIKEWRSGKEASLYLNINKQSICNALKNRAKSAYGYVWKYKI
jgi:hypothetical protein